MSAVAFDCPTCPDCGSPAGTADNPLVEYGELICTVCEHVWKGDAAALDQAHKADAAFWVLEDEAARMVGR